MSDRHSDDSAQLVNFSGWMFVLFGGLGFMPGITTSEGYLLGIFEVQGIYHLMYVIVGLLALWVSVVHVAFVRLYFGMSGLFFGMLAVMGFWWQEVPHAFALDMPINVLHGVWAIASIYVALFGVTASHASGSVSKITE